MTTLPLAHFARVPLFRAVYRGSNAWAMMETVWVGARTVEIVYDAVQADVGGSLLPRALHGIVKCVANLEHFDRLDNLSNLSDKPKWWNWVHAPYRPLGLPRV